MGRQIRTTSQRAKTTARGLKSNVLRRLLRSNWTRLSKRCLDCQSRSIESLDKKGSAACCLRPQRPALSFECHQDMWFSRCSPHAAGRKVFGIHDLSWTRSAWECGKLSVPSQTQTGSQVPTTSPTGDISKSNVLMAPIHQCRYRQSLSSSAQW